jgi:hypothetical protein
MTRLKFGAPLCSLTELNWNSIISGTEETQDQAFSLCLLLRIRQKVKPHVGVSYSMRYETDQFSVLQTFIDRGTGLPKSSQDKCMTPGK